MTFEEMERELQALKREHGELKRLFKQHAHTGLDSRKIADTLSFPVSVSLTAKDIGTVNSGDTATDDVIENNRTRLDELIQGLTNQGVIT